MILNIHGFNSSGNNSKYQWLIKNFPDENIISPTMDYANENPISIFNNLKKMILSSDECRCIIGSSLGAFLSYCLCADLGIRSILINPSLVPFLTLNQNHKIDPHICRGFAALFGRYMYMAENFVIIVGDQDEVIDHRNLTQPLFPTKEFFHIKDGCHQLDMSAISSILDKLIRG